MFRQLLTRLAAFAALAACFSPTDASAQSSAAASTTPETAAGDEAAIRHVAELYMSFDPAQLREGFYPSSNLYVAGPEGKLRVIPFDKFLENVQKGEASGRARPKGRIELIDHSGSAAIVKISEVSEEATVTDYLSLIRSNTPENGGWKVVAKAFYVDRKPQAGAAPAPGAMTEQSPSSSPATAAAQNPCDAAGEIHAFDYMLGDWTTSDSPAPSGGTAFGTSHTEKILGGCAILEHRHIEQNGKKLFDADVIWGYDVTTKRMLLFYVDDGSRTQLYEGHRENGGWEFYRDRPDKDGTMITIRVTYAPQPSQGGGFTQTVERSRGHGATWEPGQSVTTYEPKR
jgi:hypothetical protein